jgi:glycolate oxidase iron-sulfur subunit
VPTDTAPPPPTATADVPPVGAGIEYERFLDCVHCGLCTSACPTYLETGNENDGPRGRIYLMRGVVDGRVELTDTVRRHLDLCLDCRACETACPSGVQYGRLIEPFRVEMQQRKLAEQGGRPGWFQRWILHGLFPYAGRLRWALAPARWAQRSGLDWLATKLGLVRLLPQPLRRMHGLLPRLKSPPPELPEVLPAYGSRGEGQGSRDKGRGARGEGRGSSENPAPRPSTLDPRPAARPRARVGLFTGCVAEGMLPHVNRATARVLQANGCEVVVPRSQTCCAAIHYHSGAGEPALDFMQRNIAAFDFDELDAIVVNVAGCGSMLKDYGHIARELLPREAELIEQLERFSAKCRDVSEFLAELGPLPPVQPVPLRATYHDACHLCHAQGVRQQPRDLLGLVPGLEVVPLAESETCCGAAGSYNLTEPEMADRLAARKVGHILATGAEAVLVGNAGCALQIESALRGAGRGDIRVLHPIEVLDQSYGGTTP